MTWYVRSGVSLPPGNPMQWGKPAIVPILFSAQHGLFAWHPVTLLGFLGLIPFWKRNPYRTAVVVLLLVGFVYVNASLVGWWGGASFGMRRFVGVLPFMAPGIAAFGSWSVGLARRKPAIPMALAMLVLAVYNGLLVLQYQRSRIPADKAVSFQNVWGTSAILFQERFGNPFSYPANLWFAWKHETSPTQYDLLSGAVEQAGTIEVQGKRAYTYLGTGWDARSQGAAATPLGFVAVGKRCTLLLPLESGHAYDVTLTLGVPRDFQGQQQAELSINGHQLTAVTLQPGQVNTVPLAIDTPYVRQGINELEIVFESVYEQRRTRSSYGLQVPARRPLRSAALLTRIHVKPRSVEPQS